MIISCTMSLMGSHHLLICCFDFLNRRMNTFYRICLILAAVQLMTVVKDVLVGGIETSFDTVLDDLTGSGWGLELLDLHKNKNRNPC